MLDKFKSTITIAFFTALTIGLVEFYLQWQKNSATSSERMDEGLLLHDKLLGWKLRPHWNGNHLHKDFNVRYSINSEGFRSATKPLTTSNTVAVFGDSFTFGIGVNQTETFVSLLNQEVERTNNPIQFVNYGVPGYSTDQEYLLLQERSGLSSIGNVLVVVYLGNDLIDNQYPFPIQAEYSKPYYSLKNNQLFLKNTPVAIRQKTPPYTEKTLATEVMGSHRLPPISEHLIKFELGRRVVSLFSNNDNFESHLVSHTQNSLQLFTAIVKKNKQHSKAPRRNTHYSPITQPGLCHLAE